MPLSRQELLERLAAGNFDSLVGEFESAWLECKQAPYQLEKEIEKLELVKDVTGLANAGGGILLIGYATKRDDVHGADVIDELRPIPRSAFNEEQYRSIVAAWTWPSVTTLAIHVYAPQSATNDRAVIAIEVAPCPSDDYPILICKFVLIDQRADILIGYCERKHTAVQHVEAARLHALIARGMRNAEVLERLDGLNTLLVAMQPPARAPEAVTNEPDEGTTEKSSQPTATSRDPSPANDGVIARLPYLRLPPSNVDGRINDALKSVSLEGLPALILAAAPYGPANMLDLFASRDSPLVALLEDPPEIRASGFDLATDARSHIIRGQYRRAFLPELKLLEAHRDGLIIFINRGDGEGLSRSRNAVPGRRLINQLVLIENTYLFALLTKRALAGRVPDDCEIGYRLALANVGAEDLPCFLEGGPLGDWRDGPKLSETASYIHALITVPIATIPERVAYMLLSELYMRFGFELDRIPYTKKVDDAGIVIDPQAIVDAGNRK